MSLPLSAREREVLACAATGIPHAQVAERLGITGYTVRNTLFVAYRKLGVKGLVPAMHAMGWVRIGGGIGPARLAALREQLVELVETIDAEMAA